MNCPKCGYENSDESRFCEKCGVDLHGNAPDSITAPAMTKGCKIWFWYTLIASGISALSSLLLISMRPGVAIIGMLGEIGMAIGAALILFKRKKLGFYLIAIMAVVACIINIASHNNIVIAILSAILCPTISYYFVGSNKDILQ